MNKITTTITQKVDALQYNGFNWLDVLDFVGEKNFRFSRGIVSIITENGHFETIEDKEWIIRCYGENGLLSNCFTILSDDRFKNRSDYEELEVTEEELE